MQWEVRLNPSQSDMELPTMAGNKYMKGDHVFLTKQDLEEKVSMLRL